jgi:hypothetical protein
MKIMRAYSWIFLSGVVLACGGSAFTSNTDAGGSGNGGSGDGASSGVLGSGGRASGGSQMGKGGKTSGGTGNMSGSGTTGGGTTGGGTTGGRPSGGGSTGGAGSSAGSVGTGGDIATGGSAGTAGMAGTAGGPPGPIDKVCPMSLPAPGDGCADGLICSYGADIRTSCRNRATCSGGVWTIDKPVCEQLHGCPNIQVGKQCDASVAKPCLIDSGNVYCVCTGCNSAGLCTNQTVWACAGSAGGQGCPKVPPNEGQMCSGSESCGYGSCSTGNNLSTSCDGTTWSWSASVCPL